DDVLRQLGQVLRDITRSGDAVGRLGGDEMAILCPATDATQAMQLAEELHTQVSRLPTVARLTLSIGVCSMLPEDEPAAVLRWRADRALYQAKQAGRNRIVLFRPGAQQPPAGLLETAKASNFGAPARLD